MIELDQGARILIMAPHWLGDCVMAEPAIRAFLEARADLEATVLVPESLEGLFRNHPVVQRTTAYKDRGEHSGIFGRMRLWRELREQHFQAAVILRNSFGSALDAWRAGIPERLGYASVSRSWMLTEALPLPEHFKETHRSLSYLELFRHAGLDEAVELPLPKVFVAAREAKLADELIASDEGEVTHPLVAIHPGAAYGPAKMWSEQKFAAFADRLIEDHGATVLLCGTREETELASAVIGAMREGDSRPGAVRNLAGRTPGIAALAAVFARADLVVGNDSGPLHLAAATGVPSVAIYGSTSSDFTGVRGEKVRNVWERFDCSPCFKRECPKEDYMACMDAVPVARIYNEAGSLLGFEDPEFESIERAVGDTDGVKDRGQ